MVLWLALKVLLNCARIMSVFMRKYTCMSRPVKRFHSIKAANVYQAEPEFDLEYLCNPTNSEEINRNVQLRKGIGNIHRVLDCFKTLQEVKHRGNIDTSALKECFIREAKLIPNTTHPLIVEYGEKPKLVKTVNEKPEFRDQIILDFHEITKKLGIMRYDKLGNVSGNRSYYFMNELAEFEEALIKYSLSRLLSVGYQLVSVPDIVPRHILESCGMNITGEKNQIYSLDSMHYGPGHCLSGTAEMSLAGHLINTTYREQDLPVRLAAVSRCYRAEISNVMDQRGIYRVHQFTKVEMFAVTKPNDSETMLEEIRSIEESLFGDLGLHLQVLDMPPSDLGAPANRKYDIEAWMPGRNNFGEISSCSNCTDYQARRLQIKYHPLDGSEALHVHTLNGTACAVPRMLIALFETHQTKDGRIAIPVPLRKYFSNKEFIKRTKLIPTLKIIKGKLER